MGGCRYVDGLVQEYLLFRGCTGALGALEAELAGDAGRGALRADRLAGLVLGDLVGGLHARRLRSLWRFLEARVFAQLDVGLQAAAREVWGQVQRRYLVHAAASGRRDAVQEFLELEGPALLRADPQAWGPWFALAFIPEPESEPRLAPFFAPEWAVTLEETLRNLFATAFARLPLPMLLGFAATRAKEDDMQAELRELRAENQRLRAALERGRRRGAGSDSDGGSPGQGDAGGSGAPTPPGAPGALPLSRGASGGLAPAPLGGSSGSGGGGTLPPQAPASASRSFMGRSLDGAAGLLGSVASPPGSPSRMWGGLRRRSSVGSRGSSEPPASQEEAGGLLSGELGRSPGNIGARGAAGTSAGPRAFSVALQGVFSGHASSVCAVAFSPDGCSAASASDDGTVRVWAPDSGVANAGSASRRSATIRCPSPAVCLAWSPVHSESSGAALLLLGDRSGTVKAWHCDSKRYVFEREPPKGESHTNPSLLDLAAGPQAGLAAVSVGGRACSVTLLDLTRSGGEGRGPGETRLDLEAPWEDGWGVVTLDFGADSSTLLGGDTSGRLRLWDVRSISTASCFGGGSSTACARLGAGGMSVWKLGRDGELSEWDLRMSREKKLSANLSEHCGSEAPLHALQHRLSLNPAGSFLAATSRGASAPVVRLADGAVLGLLEGHSDRIMAAAWSPVADRVITGSKDRSLCTHKVVV